jgi:hypothetical protein
VKVIDPLEGLGVEERIILKWIFKEWFKTDWRWAIVKATLKLPFPYSSKLLECLSTCKAAFQELSDAVWLRENYVTVQAKYSHTPGHVVCSSCLTACHSSWDTRSLVFTVLFVIISRRCD